MFLRKGRFLVATLLFIFALGTAMNVSHAGEIFNPKPAPNFQAKTLDEKPVKLKELKGKMVLLEFWRRECSDCVLTMEKLVELRKDIPEDQLAIIGINCDEDITIARNFLRRKPANWPQIHAKSQEVNPIDLYQVKDLPAFCLIDADGDLIFRGERAKVEEIREILAPRLPDPSTSHHQ